MLAIAAALWPSRALGPLDGLPLNGTAEAIVLGVCVPILWVMHRRFLDARWARVAVVALLGIKVAGSLLLTQEGLCARFSTAAPFRTEVLTIPIEEPNGVLRSWDVRADWRAGDPACTAVIDRPYATLSAFPVWFLNFTDSVVGPSGTIHEGSVRRDIAMNVRGAVTVPDGGQFSIALDRDMRVAGTVGSAQVAASEGAPVAAELAAGTHAVDLHIMLTGDRWKFLPTWNGRDAFEAAKLTVAPERTVDAWLAPIARYSTILIIGLLLVGWTAAVVVEHRASPILVAWTAAASVLLVAIVASGRFERVAIAALIGAPFVPLAKAHRTWRGVLLLVGVPWLAFFVARSLPEIGQISAYSVDDWLAYQVAGYRVYMNGFWLEGGSRVFDYQPLYRWISGALHLVFGDSSVGEVYWDAACLLAGALAAFTFVSPVAGFRWGVAAAAVTLVTFTVGTMWYFVGRGLSEVSAAGFAFCAALCVTAARKRPAAAVGAGVLAVAMFYTRLNHLIFAVFLIALLVPVSVGAAWRRGLQAVRTIDPRPAFVYIATFGTGVMLFALRTWWYTGAFSIFHGTSLKNNDTGLRLSTLGSLDVWKRIAHSLSSLVWMNEPPYPDPRAVVVVVGVVLAAAALLQFPRVNRLPLSIAVVIVGAGVSSLFAHTHNYPGRMSIHLIPFAVAVTACAVAKLLRAAASRTPQARRHQTVPA